MAEEKEFLKSLIQETTSHYLRAVLMQSYDKAKKDIMENFGKAITIEQYNTLRNKIGIID